MNTKFSIKVNLSETIRPQRGAFMSFVIQKKWHKNVARRNIEKNAQNKAHSLTEKALSFMNAM